MNFVRLTLLSLILLATAGFGLPVYAAVGDACTTATAQSVCGNGYVCSTTDNTGGSGTCQPDSCNASCDYDTQICVGRIGLNAAHCFTPPPPAASSGGNAPTQAQNANNASGGGLTNPLNAGSLPELLKIVLDAVIQLGTIALVLALVWVGFLFVFAQGAEEKIRDARSALLWTVAGGLLLLGAQTISLVIAATVGQL